MNSQAAALHNARKQITELQGEMTARAIKLAKEIEKLDAVLSVKESKEFLKLRCGLASSDISTLVKFSKTLKGREEILQKHRVPFPVIKRLVTASEDVRNEALARISSGARFDISDFGAISKRFANLTEAEAIARSQRRTIRRIAKQRNSEALTQLETEAGDLMEKVASLPNTSFGPSVQEHVEEIKSHARQVLPLFERLFGSEFSLPGDVSFNQLQRSHARLAFAHRSLSNLAHRLDSSGRSVAEQADLIFREKDGFSGAIARAIGNMRYQSPPPRPWKAPRTALKTLPKRRFTVLELCAGAGGLALGLEAAGFKHVALVEMNSDAASTMRLNRPDWPVIEADMTTIDFTRYAGQVDLVCGGLPCQAYSEEGHGLGKDDPRDLLMEGARAVREIRPKAFMFENVRGMLHAPHADQVARFVKGLADAGYEVQIVEVNTKDYGIAQDRPRVLILGMHAKYRKRFKMPPAFPERRANLGDILLDLMAGNGWKGATAWAEERRNQSFELDDGSVVTGALAWTIKGRQGKSRFFEGRRWAKIGLTAAGLPDEAPSNEQAEKAGAGFVPGMTLRMRARVQDFPDDYQFCGGKESVAQQIGNAVAPRLGQAMGLALYSALQGCEFDYETLLWPKTASAEGNSRLEIDPPSLEGDDAVEAAVATPKDAQIAGILQRRSRFANN